MEECVYIAKMGECLTGCISRYIAVKVYFLCCQGMRRVQGGVILTCMFDVRKFSGPMNHSSVLDADLWFGVAVAVVHYFFGWCVGIVA